MSDKFEMMSVFGQLQAGLEDSIANSRGQISLKTTELPAPPPRATGRTVARLRKRLKMSQAVFAATLNVSHKTVQSWEQGTREPSDTALRFLQVINEQPDVVRGIFRTSKPRLSSGNRAQKKRRRATHRTWRSREATSTQQ